MSLFIIFFKLNIYWLNSVYFFLRYCSLINQIHGTKYCLSYGNNYLILFHFQILYSNSKNNVIYKFSQKNSDSDNYCL